MALRPPRAQQQPGELQPPSTPRRGPLAVDIALPDQFRCTDKLGFADKLGLAIGFGVVIGVRFPVVISTSSTASATATASASLSAFIAASPSASASASAGTTTPPPELCVSVQRGQASIQRGQNAAYVVEVSAENGSAADVSVTLTSQPSSQKPAFISGCAKGKKRLPARLVRSRIRSPSSFDAQVPVAADATSVSSVTLTATASIVTYGEVDAARGRDDRRGHLRAGLRVPADSERPGRDRLPLGPVPTINGVPVRPSTVFQAR